MCIQKSQTTGILQRFFFSAITIAIFAALMAPTTWAQTQANVPASKDNTLYESSTGTPSNGAGEHFFVGSTARAERRRGLLAFDIAGNVPAGATINKVTLKLHMSRTASGAQFVKLHRVLSDWGEGTSNAFAEEGGGTNPTTGDATWIHRFFNTIIWTTVGGDFADTVSDSQTVSEVGFYTWGSTPQMVNDVQTWLNVPSSNFGWLLRDGEGSASTSKRFDTRENPNADFRPLLTVDYTAILDVKDNSGLPTAFALHENFPNPFTASAFKSATTIRYELPRNAPVRLEVYDLLGEKIRTLVNAVESAGVKQISWDGTNDTGQQVARGVYLYRIAAGAFTATRKLTILQ